MYHRKNVVVHSFFVYRSNNDSFFAQAEHCPLSNVVVAHFDLLPKHFMTVFIPGKVIPILKLVAQIFPLRSWVGRSIKNTSKTCKLIRKDIFTIVPNKYSCSSCICLHFVTLPIRYHMIFIICDLLFNNYH